MPRDLPLSNGRLLVAFDGFYRLREFYWPRVGEPNHLQGEICRVGIWTPDGFAWTDSDGWSRQLRYADQTLVTDAVLRHDGLGLELRFHDAVDFFEDVLVRRITITDLRGAGEREVRLYLHHGFTLYGQAVADTAFYDPATRAIIHYKSSCNLLVCAAVVGTPTDQVGLSEWATGHAHVPGSDGTWRDAEDGQLGNNPISQGAVDSTFGLRLTVPSGGTTAVDAWITAGETYETATRLHHMIVERGAGSFIERTGNYWRLWLRKEGRDLAPLSPELLDRYHESLLILRTQVDSGGAIIAANDSDSLAYARDTYSYLWPRDGALVCRAFDQAGYREVTARFYFLVSDLIRPEGYLLHKYLPSGRLASSWHPWWGDGVAQLPIQEDETALVVWSLWKHFEQHRDIELIRPMYKTLVKAAADFMVAYRCPETRLQGPSYDLWEERRGLLTFTAAAVVGGLVGAANFAVAFGEHEVGAGYLAAADEIRAAMRAHLWDPALNRFRRMINVINGETTVDSTIDASLYGLFAFGCFPADDPMVASTMAQVGERLWVKTPVGGLARYENDSYYQVSGDIENVPGNPWFVCTSWLGLYHLARANTLEDLEPARKILCWMSEHASDSGVMAEQVNPYTDAPIRFVYGGASEIDIDHVVALGDAWQKGAATWPASKRLALANDPLNLLAVDAGANRAKGDGDAATWLPANKTYRCTYVARQVAVKREYALWVTAAEHDAMIRVLSGCATTALPAAGPAPTSAQPPRSSPPTTRTTPMPPAPKPTPRAPRPTSQAPQPAGAFYKNCAAVRAAGAAPIYAGQPGYSRKLDRDGDGIGCEN